ncbi:MAG: pyridoxal-5'-phosphate-dependent protein subunit beta [Thermotogae bacterium]|nr:MAG: pyridoxal-5'-phosphate-dependent protein subunit beta [Thermotogota bacterium]
MSQERKKIIGPTYEEMLHPWKIPPEIRQKALEMKTKDPLDPINLFNITWRDENDQIRMYVLPEVITGVETPIVVLFAKDFPTSSHKVGATYSVLVEKVVRDEVDPFVHTLVWPSTGNYGIGGAWVGCRMGFDSVVILPEEMSQERFDIIRSYGARVIATPGCESNVKEIYDKSKELYAQNPEKVRILNQFSEFGNYRFHYYVTGNTMLEAVQELAKRGIGKGKISAIVAGVGSAGTIACGDRVKEVTPDTKVVALEPIQCPTLSLNGYGGHDIQGIGDKHVTWIHHVTNMDAVVAVDDVDSKKGLQLFTDDAGKEYMSKQGLSDEDVEEISSIFGISGVANVIGSIKMAKYYGLGKDDLIFTIATDNIQRYHSVMEDLTKKYGKMDLCEAKNRHERIFLKAGTDWIFEGTRDMKLRWHNLKYYTWVEQQGKTVEELNAQLTEEYWKKQQEMVYETDKLIREYRKGA